MSGRDHYDIAEKILANLGGEQDAVWSTALATRALAHATLAGAARDYGLHVGFAVPPVITGNVTVDTAVMRARADLYETLAEEQELFDALPDTETLVFDRDGFHVQRD
jgi:hypothetical protein